jgi:hypothetical protein
VSTLWTPSGEHEPQHDSDLAARQEYAPEAGGDATREPTPEELEEMLRARAELAAVPVADIVANHAVGLWQLAILHLMPEPGPDGAPGPPRLAEAGLAIDALGALVDGLGERLAPHDEALREALSQLRLAYVEVAGGAGADTPS